MKFFIIIHVLQYKKKNLFVKFQSIQKKRSILKFVFQNMNSFFGFLEYELLHGFLSIQNPWPQHYAALMTNNFLISLSPYIYIYILLVKSGLNCQLNFSKTQKFPPSPKPFLFAQPLYKSKHRITPKKEKKEKKKGVATSRKYIDSTGTSTYCCSVSVVVFEESTKKWKAYIKMKA